MFWTITWLILLVAGTLCLKPLLSASKRWKLASIVTVLLLPVAVYLLYQGVGTPAALNTAAHPAMQPGQSDMNNLTEQLRNRLSEDPEQVEGWILLGRSYKTLQKYPEALAALETANRLVPDQPLIEVELVEAQLFASGNPRLTPDMISRLERAVTQEPTLQKGLWLLGIAAAQTGDDTRAIAWWEQLSKSLEPGSEIAESVQEQITLARDRLGLEPDVTTASTSSWPGSEVVVELSPSAVDTLTEPPPGSVLFIIVREAGLTGGPPLGVRRVESPHFPVQLVLDDRDSMLPQNPISSRTRMSLQARLSLTGQPTASAGDWQSSAVEISIDAGKLSRLTLDQQLE